MKLADHVQRIKQITRKAFDNQFSRLGIGASKLLDVSLIAPEQHDRRAKIEELILNHIGETGTFANAREKALDELAFTLFNRIAAIKVMEARTLFPEVITKRPENGDRSFQHKAWLEQHPDQRNDELEGLREFIKEAFDHLGEGIALYHRSYPYALLPHTVELNEIMEAFNAVAKDRDVDEHIWASDDILGWLYESYNNDKKREHKDSGAKTEYHKVSLQSQVYTPRWVVEFLVQNSLGKLYLEMYPDSDIRHRYKIANAPQKQERERKPLHLIKLIDPACGSGNFLLYAFYFFYQLYLDQIENYGADYDEDEIPALILENNIHGIDLDDRAIQLAQLGLYIIAKTHNRRAQIPAFKVVSSDFYLPDYEEVAPMFEDDDVSIGESLRGLLKEIWSDLQNAYRFGSLLRIEEKVNNKIVQLDSSATPLFGDYGVQVYADFKVEFFPRIREAVKQYSGSRATQFIKGKTLDALTFLEIITQTYEVAVANPPYTDCADFGAELKSFVDTNYKKPYKFNSNLYATFIKRCAELTEERGFVGIIHPHTFMFIKTFEDVRRYLIDKTHIEILVDYGLDRVNLFGTGILLDATFFVFCKKKSEVPGIFFNIANNQQEKYKKGSFENVLIDVVKNRSNYRAYYLPQSKLKIINGWPFIYWISDGFREKFKGLSFSNAGSVVSGIKTGNNDKLLRYWWEVHPISLSNHYLSDLKPWVKYAKGGRYNKWYGNNWLCVNYKDNGDEIKKSNNYNLLFPKNLFKKGITYSATSTKGVSFRLLEDNQLFDMKGSSILFDDPNMVEYSLGLLNSKLSFYIAKCLNGTVETQVGDIKRIPFVLDNEESVSKVSEFVRNCIIIRKELAKYSIVDSLHFKSPLNGHSSLISKVKSFLDFENFSQTIVYLLEAKINEQVFNIYDLSSTDAQLITSSEGFPIGGLPIDGMAKEEFIKCFSQYQYEFLKNSIPNIRDWVYKLQEEPLSEQQIQTIVDSLPLLYQNNNDLEEFCIKHSVNPINVWFLFKNKNIIPIHRAHDIALEFITHLIREILKEDEDGISPLVRNAGEEVLLDRIELKMQEKGFSSAQISQVDVLLGRSLNYYLENYFFRELSEHLNLFPNLPKTPFIWHLSSGPNRGFECYLLIYKWNKDKLLLLKSVYVEKRERSLINRKTDLLNDTSAKGQNERDLIDKQLNEIAEFKRKINDLLASGYDPKLDDGVGKNIAPLQQRGMLTYEVLNAKQLPKYLNADW